MLNTGMILDGFVSPEQMRKERLKSQELKASQWWKQQIGPGLCFHCHQKFSKNELTMEHLIPISRGGKSNKKNVVPSCRACNTTKGHKLAVEISFEQL